MQHGQLAPGHGERGIDVDGLAKEGLTEVLVASVDGVQMLKKSITNSTDKAAETGTSLADDLLIQGAGKILNEVYQHETFNADREDL